MDDPDYKVKRDLSPPPEVTPQLFAEWCAARRGETHAERLTNPVWDWLVRAELGPYSASKYFGGSLSSTESPRWTFSRYGMSETVLADGRRLFVAGEYEDYYDPQFFIFNDVIVQHPDDSLEVVGYPADDFPPTDFHSATLVDRQLLLIGSLSYPQLRNPLETQCFSLDTDSLRLTRLCTSGENPGWIFKHSAELVDGAIVFRGGQVGGPTNLRENADDWRLDLGTLSWSRLTDRQWSQFSIRRADRKPSQLSKIRRHLSDLRLAERRREEGEMRKVREASAGFARDGVVIDQALVDSLFDPPVDHLGLVRRESDRFHVFRIQIGDVVVRYIENHWSIEMIVEGPLPTTTVDALILDLCTKLGRLENTQYIAVQK